MGQRLTEKPNRYFTFLRSLRAGGRSNMYGAIPYLMSAFGIERDDAFRVVCEWIDTQTPAAAGPENRPPMRSGARAPELAEPSLFDQAVSPARAAPASSKPSRSKKPQGAKPSGRKVA